MVKVLKPLVLLVNIKMKLVNTSVKLALQVPIKIYPVNQAVKFVKLTMHAAVKTTEFNVQLIWALMREALFARHVRIIAAIARFHRVVFHAMAVIIFTTVLALFALQAIVVME